MDVYKEKILDLQNICFGFQSPYLFHGLNLEVKDPGFFLFTGPNGVGKTTLFKLILGFLKPASGEIRILGVLPKQARKWVGYVPQRFSVSNMPIRVIDVVASQFVNSRVLGLRSLKRDRLRAEEVLVSFGLQDMMKKEFSSLSGGQSQQVLLARAVASPKKILLLDEPMSNIDSLSKELFYEKLLELHKSGVNIILISHDIASFSKHKGQMMFLHNRQLSTYENFSKMESELFHPSL